MELDADARRIVLRVDQASRAARSSRGREVAVDLAHATLRLPDADGDTRSTLRDVFPGNRVEVRVAPGGLDRQTITGARLIHLEPEMPVGGLSRLWKGR